MNLIKVLSTSIDSMKRRVIKFTRFGNFDVQTSVQATAYGIDSNPINGMVAIYAPTTSKGDTYIIGYINKNQLADVGETRLFSTDEKGNVKFYTWLKNDGTCELGGNIDNAVRYSKLNISLQQEVTKINAELTKIAAVLNSLAPGSYILTPITLDISTAKINEIKTL